MAEVMTWGIKSLTFRLGVPLQKKVRHPNHSATEDATDNCFVLKVLYSIGLCRFNLKKIKTIQISRFM